MSPRPGWTALALLALAIAVPGSLRAQAGEPRADPVPRDVEFGITPRRKLGLEREVQMYQWRPARGGYVGTWSPRPIDSSRFPARYRNPGDLPVEGARWLPDRITVDGTPLSDDVVERLGQWRALRPDFAALPGNLAATFQPEGDGLGSADNPLAPEVGDLRIRWRELVLPPLEGRLVLRDGRWHLSDLPPQDNAPTGPPAALAAAAPGRGWWAWAAVGAGVLLLLALALVVRRR